MSKKSKQKAKAERSHPWREHIEALTVAIVIALVFKAFLIEISRIPSPSMQPTLMGMTATVGSSGKQVGIFDRLVVDKLSFHFRDPRRFEIVVFRHPIERSRSMVKRVIGLPGEELRIANGDVWVRSGPDEPERILRRPRSVQDETWRALDPDEPRRTSWRMVEGRGWAIDGRSIDAPAAGVAGFRRDEEPFNHYWDGYPELVRQNEDSMRTANQDRRLVGDLRLEGTVEARPDCTAVVVELREGSQVHRFRIPGPAAPADAVPSIEDSAAHLPGSAATEEAGSPYRLPASRRVSFAAQNLDDLLELEIDGEWRCAKETFPVEQAGASLSLALEGGGASLDDLQVLRDVYYTVPVEPWRDCYPGQTFPGEEAVVYRVPEGHYFMLGDNTQNSADGRAWLAVSFESVDPDTGETTLERANWRGLNADNPRPGTGPDGEPVLWYRNEWGERRMAPNTAENREPGRHGALEFAHFVPRELIQGRALAVFWPIKPHWGIWRLAWLH